MARLAKTNDAGDDSVTKWVWVDSHKQDDLLQTLIGNNLIDKQDMYHPQTLSYFKVTAKRENIEKIKETIQDLNVTSFSQNESFNPSQDWAPKARLASSAPLAAKLKDDPGKYT